METLTPPDSASQGAEPELHLLPDSELTTDWLRWRTAVIGSAVFHVIAVTLLLVVKTGPPPPEPPERAFLRHVTPLYIPPDLTQKAPNKEPIKKELTIASIAPAPRVKAPAPAPPAKQSQMAKQAPPPPPAAVVPPKAITIEAPKLEAAAPVLPNVQLPKSASLPPPPSITVPPKLVLEDVAPPHTAGNGKPTGLIVMPGTTLAETLRSVTHPGSQAGLTIGDDEAGSGGGVNLPASAGRPRSSLELKSDPLGVDFRGYITQVLAAVRRNWFAVYPEAARLGQRGQVVVKFQINKRGGVGTVNFGGMTGSRPLDQAAVAAISASNPLPPLPAEFKGDQIVLQMTFSYNMPK